MSVPGGSQGGMQSRPGIFLCRLFRKVRNLWDRIKFEEISLEKQKREGQDGPREPPTWAREPGLLAPFARGAVHCSLTSKVSWDPLGLGFLILPKVPLLHLRQGNA